LKPVKVGLLGLGTVGGGTYQVLNRNADEIARRVGREIEVSHIAARDVNVGDFKNLDKIKLGDDAFAVVNDPEVDIVVELIGGYEPARELVLQAIAQGKHVVTANKALIAMHGTEIFEAASKKGVMVAFEAAVAGGIPIIKALREGLAGNRINWLAGIINGTGNFILTEMQEKGRDFNDVLQEAQALGYAEADPTFDVEGIDAAHKLAILGAIAFGVPLQFDKVYTEGISQITRDDVNYAEQLGYRIKHLGIARKVEKGIEMRVHPTLIPEKRLIANVNGVMNAVLVQADALGPTLYYGAGAGAEPTASAVVADIVDISRMLTADSKNRVPPLGFQSGSLVNTTILTMDDVETAYYLRLQTLDQIGVIAQVSRILADQNISIEAMIQKERDKNVEFITVILLTHKVLEKNMNAAIKQIEALSSIKDSVCRIRMETLET